MTAPEQPRPEGVGGGEDTAQQVTASRGMGIRTIAGITAAIVVVALGVFLFVTNALSSATHNPDGDWELTKFCRYAQCDPSKEADIGIVAVGYNAQLHMDNGTVILSSVHAEGVVRQRQGTYRKVDDTHILIETTGDENGIPITLSGVYEVIKSGDTLKLIGASSSNQWITTTAAAQQNAQQTSQVATYGKTVKQAVVGRWEVQSGKDDLFGPGYLLWFQRGVVNEGAGDLHIKISLGAVGQVMSYEFTDENHITISTVYGDEFFYTISVSGDTLTITQKDTNTTITAKQQPDQ